MVISVLSSQDTEFFKDNPSPVYTFVVYVTKMVDITPPQGKETALPAGRHEVQEGVKVKCFVTTTLNPVWIAWNTCPLHDCESKYPCPTIL